MKVGTYGYRDPWMQLVSLDKKKSKLMKLYFCVLQRKHV